MSPVLAGLVDRLLDDLGGLGAGLLHLVVAGLAFAETALFLDILVPGEVGMVLSGAAARRADIGLVGLIGAGALGATIGDSCSYAIGRWAGDRDLRWWPGLARRIEKRRARAEDSFARHGAAAVFFGRWVGALRAVVPFVAGAARMPYRRFLFWNVLASVGWVATVLTVGWVVGETVASTVDRISGILSVAAVAGLVAWWLLRRRRARRTARTEQGRRSSLPETSGGVALRRAGASSAHENAEPSPRRSG